MATELYHNSPGKVDLNSTYRTRHGREVKLIAVNPGGQAVGAYVDYDGYWQPHSWNSRGKSPKSDILDLVEPRLKHTRFLNIYRNRPGALQAGGMYDTREEAEQNKGESEKVAIVPLEFFEGEGLDFNVLTLSSDKVKYARDHMTYFGSYQGCSLYTAEGRWFWENPTLRTRSLHSATSKADAMGKIDEAIAKGNLE